MKLARALGLGCAGAVALALALFALPAQALEIPALQSHVNDYAGLLSPEAARRLERRLSTYEANTGHQFALLTVPNLQGEPIENFSIKVAEKWKLGRQKPDDGLIVLVARDEHKMRIEVGYGLEGDVPDVVAARIIREIMRPAFQRGDYDAGIAEAFEALMHAAGGDPGPDVDAPPPARQVHREPVGSVVWTLIVLFVLARLFLGGGGGGRPRRGFYWFGPGGFGGFGGGGFGGGGFGGGGFGGGGGGGSDGGGGYSGGGGGFGGGGASGDW